MLPDPLERLKKIFIAAVRLNKFLSRLAPLPPPLYRPLRGPCSDLQNEDTIAPYDNT